MIELEEVKKIFTQGNNQVPVLQGVNFSLAAGKTAAILGPSGSGKSTLLNIISGIETPTSGTISLNGKSYGDLNEGERSQMRFDNFGFVFQQFNLLEHLNVLENVLFPLQLKNKDRATEIALSFLKRVGLEHRLAHFPATLSGGEKQRVAIARALAGGPKLILADEPSGSLDIESGKKIINLFFDLISESGASMILVTHNPELAEHCDAAYIMDAGILNSLNK